MKEFTITSVEEGQRFDKYLIKLLPEAGKSFIYKMLRKKNITLNNKKADGSESKTYILKSEIPYIMVGWTNEKYKFVEPSGGPKIIENSILPEANAKVETITYVKNYGYTITFK